MSERTDILPSGTMLHGGQYRIDRHLASGGFGNTYLAMDVNLNAKVAIKEFYIKTMNYRESDSRTVGVSNTSNLDMFHSLRNKFKKEAQRIFKIQHGNVVRVFSLFEEYGTVYYAMDFIEGESLNSRIKRDGPVGEPQARSVFLQMLDALEVVHQSGFFHLDIKPHNIMLTPDGVVKLIDFGASKHANKAEATTITGFAFTPEYAPPELTNQEYDEIGPWTDIYSLGITLYRILSDAPMPSKKDIRLKGVSAFVYSQPVSDAMQQLIVNMTQGASERRPQSIAQLRALVNQLGLSEDVTPQPTNEETVAKPAPKPVSNPKPKPVSLISSEKTQANNIQKKKSKLQTESKPQQKKDSSKTKPTTVISSEETQADNIQKPKPEPQPESKPQQKKDSSKTKPAPVIGSEETQVDNKQKLNPEPQPESKPKSKLNKKLIYIGAAVALVLIAFVAYLSLTGSDSENNELTGGELEKKIKLVKVEGSREFDVNGVKFTMVPVEGGTFNMGATPEQGSDAGDDEKPTHQVTLSSYYIGQTEVTQELWQAVMGDNPSSYTGNKCPVEYVSWNDCQEFIRKLNALTGQQFRLPTEAEWEYAARGGNKSQGYKYSGSNNIDDVAWYINTDSIGETHDVATKHPNELGIYDMSGNVDEWCQDWYGSYSSDIQTNPQGPTSGSSRVNRGGSWLSSVGYCRVAIRCRFAADYRTHIGLRLAQ